MYKPMFYAAKSRLRLWGVLDLRCASSGCQVSSHGRVSTATGKVHFGQANDSGYLKARFDGQDYYVHRLVATAFLGPPPDPTCWQVNHIDGNPANNFVANLQYVTPAENQRHSWANNPNRQQGNAKLSKAVLWRPFGMQAWTFSASQIEAARTGKTWLVHRAVAATFLGQPDTADIQVNHKDFDRGNNHMQNLEYVSCSENITHSWQRRAGNARSRAGKAVQARSIACASSTGPWLDFDSMAAAERHTGIHWAKIDRICRGLVPGVGWDFKFVDDVQIPAVKRSWGVSGSDPPLQKEVERRWTEASQAWTQVLELATPMFGAGHERTVEHQLRLKRAERLARWQRNMRMGIWAVTLIVPVGFGWSWYRNAEQTAFGQAW
ncbi:yosQ, partial [Symbiodinium necroappetens]